MAIAFAFVINLGVHAIPPTGKSVSGKIKTSASANAVGASVAVTCNGTTLNDTTDSNGDFDVAFTDVQCPDDTNIDVSASFNGESGADSRTSGNGTVVSFGTIFLSAVAVPEFGAWTALAAVVGSGFVFFMMKKRTAETV